MHDLVKGVHQFHNVGRRQHLELFENLKHGQNPEACFITCADSRILPNLITDSEPGQLFTIRNVGNLIPCYGTSNNGEMAAVEYAVVELGIRDLIICGHTGCGAMKALMTPFDPLQRPHVPSVVNWLKHADATAEIVRTHYPNLSGEELIQVTAEENVLVQLEHLKTLPVIAARFPTGDVRLHGWMYKIDTGEVFYFDSEVGQFVKFGDEPREDSSQKRKAGTRGKS